MRKVNSPFPKTWAPSAADEFKSCATTIHRLAIHTSINNVRKVLRAGVAVQLIVFFARIREILKKEIYGFDKECFAPNENKRQVEASRGHNTASY
jgi:hypothetical protein